MRFSDQPTEVQDLAGTRGRTVDSPPIASGRCLGGRYRLERPLARGGMAAVWLAADGRLGRRVAVKVLSDTLASDPEYLARFRREARVAAGLQHPNLVAVYDYGAGERPYLVMEYVEGGDLARRLESGEAPDPERLARELLSALRHIHRAGVLHRDIKPQNVLVDHHGRARLTDFGIAQPRDATSITRAGQVIGTEAYIAPEVRRGDPATESSDLYSLGMVLADAARAGAGAALWDLTERMRDPIPGRRPSSAAAALAELDRAPVARPGEPTEPLAVAEPEPPSPRPFDPSPTGMRRSPRSPLTAVLAVGLIALAIAGFVALAAGGGDDGSQGVATERAKKEGSAGGGGGDSGSAAAGGSGGGQPAETPAGSTATGAGAGAGTDGAALNDRGYALVGQGQYEQAVPVLGRAVDALRDSGDETTYNYALYNLGTAYLGAGRPEDAIPVLEERMGFDDGQLEEVQAKLDEAYAAAGEKAPKPKESGGQGPPPWANAEEDAGTGGVSSGFAVAG